MENFEPDSSDFDSYDPPIWFVKELQEWDSLGVALFSLWSFPEKEFESVKAKVNSFLLYFRACEIRTPQNVDRYEKSISRSIELRPLEPWRYRNSPAFGAKSHLQSLEMLWKATANGFLERVRGEQAPFSLSTKSVRWPILGNSIDDSLPLIDWLQKNREASCFASVYEAAEKEILSLMDPEVLLRLQPDFETTWGKDFFMGKCEPVDIPYFVLGALEDGESLYTKGIIAFIRMRTDWEPTRKEIEPCIRDMEKLGLISKLGGRRITQSGRALFRAWAKDHQG